MTEAKRNWDLSDVMERKTGFINGLRALAAFWVLSAHCMIWGGGPLLPDPKLAVDLFMLISGFLMALHVTEREATEPLTLSRSWLSFCARRLFRIAPTYYLALLSVLIFSSYFLSGYSLLRDSNPAFWQKKHGYDDPSGVSFTLSNVFAHVTFAFGLLPRYSSSTMLPDWSIGLEMQFYLVFPALYLAMRH